MEAFLASIQRFAKPWIPAQLAGPLDSMDGHIAGFTGITGLALPLLLLLSLVLCFVLTRMLFGDSASTSTNRLVWLHAVLTVFGLLWLAIACFCFACARSGEGGLPHGDRVLLLGDSGAGKSVMFYQVKLFDSRGATLSLQPSSLVHCVVVVVVVCVDLLLDLAPPLVHCLLPLPCPAAVWDKPRDHSVHETTNSQGTLAC